MPFSAVKDEFQPEELAKLTDAFHLAWPEVLIARGASTPAQLGWLRQTLAGYIIASARLGEFDPVKLKKEAVAALTGGTCPSDGEQTTSPEARSASS